MTKSNSNQPAVHREPDLVVKERPIAAVMSIDTRAIDSSELLKLVREALKEGHTRFLFHFRVSPDSRCFSQLQASLHEVRNQGAYAYLCGLGKSKDVFDTLGLHPYFNVTLLSCQEELIQKCAAAQSFVTTTKDRSKRPLNEK